MTLTNNQIGRVQLLLQELLVLLRVEHPDNEDAQDFAAHAYDLFTVQELQQISSDIKDIYNVGKPVTLEAY